MSMQRNDTASSSSFPEDAVSAAAAAAVQHNECQENDSSSRCDAGSQCKVLEELSTERTNADASKDILNNSGNLEESRESQSQTRVHADAGGGLKGEGVVAPVPARMFYLAPLLRDTFTAVGATNKAYSFREILHLFKAYLYSNRSLFDPSDVLYVNCGKDSLGQALGVDRFHYNDVKPLLAKNIIPAESLHEVMCVKSLPFSVSGSSAQERIKDPDSRISLNLSHSTTTKIDRRLDVNSAISKTNDKTPLPPDDCLPTSSKTLGLASASGASHNPQKPRHISGYSTSSPVPGPSRQTPEEIITCVKNNWVLPSIYRRWIFPSVPESGSESESTYSVQGYETALCFNTEYEESELCGEDSENAPESEQDSVIEDVGVAVLALHALCESERDFWPDGDNDTDESTETDDPELVAECWYCLSCGEKNKPFVRYCSKCWQLRKNWLPERSKKHKRRKPRPKNKKKKLRHTDILSQVDVLKPGQVNYNLNPLMKHDNQTPKTGDPSSCSDVLTEHNTPSTSYSLDRCGSQDSDIFSSRGTSSDHSQELKQDDLKALNLSSYVTDFRSTNSKDMSLISGSEKLPRCKIATKKRVCTSSQACDEILLTKQNEKLTEGIKRFFKFLVSKAGIKWLNSADGKCFLASQTVQETLKKKVMRNKRNTSTVTDLPQSSRWASLLCSVCHGRPKNASIIHGRLCHQATCYQCAQRLLNSGLPCPQCHRKIHMVCKHILV